MAILQSRITSLKGGDEENSPGFELGLIVALKVWVERQRLRSVGGDRREWKKCEAPSHQCGAGQQVDRPPTG